jgi:hypothetical protein
MSPAKRGQTPSGGSGGSFRGAARRGQREAKLRTNTAFIEEELTR